MHLRSHEVAIFRSEGEEQATYLAALKKRMSRDAMRSLGEREMRWFSGGRILPNPTPLLILFNAADFNFMSQ